MFFECSLEICPAWSVAEQATRQLCPNSQILTVCSNLGFKRKQPTIGSKLQGKQETGRLPFMNLETGQEQDRTDSNHGKKCLHIGMRKTPSQLLPFIIALQTKMTEETQGDRRTEWFGNENKDKQRVTNGREEDHKWAHRLDGTGRREESFLGWLRSRWYLRCYPHFLFPSDNVEIAIKKQKKHPPLIHAYSRRTLRHTRDSRKSQRAS